MNNVSPSFKLAFYSDTAYTKRVQQQQQQQQ
jgi:hypothetical protein